MNETQIKTTAKNWYTLGRNFLPEFDSLAFAQTAGKSHAFAYEVAGNKVDISLIVDPTIDTAYVDLYESRIAISAKYFSRELYVNRYGKSGAVDTEALAISLINGSVIHEALHIYYTAKDGAVTMPEAVTSTYKGRDTVEKYGMANTCTAFNIIEDIFIEENCPKKVAVWLQACSDILFSRENLDREWDLTQLDDFMNLAICWKNKENRDHVAFENFSPTQLTLLKKAAIKYRTYHSLRTRLDIAMDFLNTFEIEAGEGGDGEDGPESESDETEGTGKATSESSESEGEGTGGGKPADTTATPDASEEMREALDATEDPSEAVAEAIAKELKETAEEITTEESATEKYKEEGHYEITWKKLVEKDITETELYKYSTSNPKTEINFKFLKNLQAIRTANRTPGAARKSGSVMIKSRLTRIATDGKIFAKNDSTRNTLKRIEVIINVDFSGSTSGPVIDNELGAAKAMSQVLRQAGIAHSVYGHTAIGSGDVPFLFHIFSYDMEVTNPNFEERFVMATKISLSQNFDGVIIKRLGEKFTGRNGKQFLINLSDGEPAAPGYSGYVADKHTQEEIESLRAKGIGVFAISVVSGVVSGNDRIYGKDFNIDGSRNTNSQFQKLIEKIAKG